MDARIAAWWNDVLAGETDEPHPIHGQRVVVHLNRDRLELRGVLDRRQDREAVVREARARIGHGVREVDASHLVVAPRQEEPGMLDQTLVACYSDRATAELGRKFVLEHSRVNASKDAIVDAPDAAKLRSLMPDAYVADVQGRMERGEAVWVVRVDETAAFTVRGLIEEETRQRWTLAVPPEVAHG